MLVKDIYNIDIDKEVLGLSTDSRFIKPGYIFVPKKGSTFCGIEFIIDATNKGAILIVTDTIINTSICPVILVDDIDKELKRLVNLIYGKPYNNICMIGITGTDGKTSTSTIASYLLNNIGLCANIGTNGITYEDSIIENILTTPILTENYRLIKEFCDNNYKYVSMEVSSQGIKNKRIDGILYDYCVFTNLSHEHLDTHKTMHNYFLTKLKLFKQLKKTGKMIVNKDDYYAKFFDKYDGVIYYSIFVPSDYQATHIRYFENHAVFDLKTPFGILSNIRVNKVEEYNIYNILPGIIIALNEGLNVNLLYELLLELPIVPGRMEKVPTRYPIDVYVDFAHTPNALKNAIRAVKKKAKGSVIVVCGAAGRKDKSKRPLMGRVACIEADVVIFTSEDPRTEAPLDIINDMTKNLSSNINNYHIIENRKEAITYAFKIAKKNDVILVTGKGRENYFEENKKVYEYSDFDFILDLKI